MSQGLGLKLFFIKAQDHNVQNIVAFLNKRNFVVTSETDMRVALTKILEFQPDFIFLAWDHENPKVLTLPKFIAQASNAVIIPYIMSNSKEANRKLNICKINPKLYPPISGPAIERLILKFRKQSNTNQQSNLISSAAKSKKIEDLVKINSALLAELDNSAQDTSSDFEEQQPEHNSQMLQAEQVNEQNLRSESIDKFNNFLNQTNSKNLSEEQTASLRKSFDAKVKIPLEKLLEDLSSSTNENLSSEQSSNSEILIQKGVASADGFGNYHDQNKASQLLKTNIVEFKRQNEQPQYDLNFDDIAREKNTNNLNLKAYCMSIYSETWCGYLVVTSDVSLDFSSMDLIFTDWIKEHFSQIQEIDDYDFFEFYNVDSLTIEHLNKKADYSESVNINGHNISVSFFEVNAQSMQLQLNDEKNYILISTEDIPSGKSIDFNLYLHLPENKKYILYTQAKKPLELEQKKRLINNKVFTLFSPVEFEKECKKLKAETNLKEIYISLNRKFNKQ